MAQTIIGLDIGHYSVKAVRLEGGYRGFTILGFDEEILEAVHVDAGAIAHGDTDEVTPEQLEDAVHDAEDAALHTALLALRERGSLDGDVVVVAMPPDLVLSATMPFPFVESRALNAVIPLNFEERIPVPVNELVLDHFVVGQSAAEPGQFDVTVVAVKQEDLRVFLDIWQTGGVDPHQVVMGDASMAHLANHLLEDLSEPFALVDIGHKFTRVACLEPREDAAHSVGYLRSFQTGGHDVTLRLVEAFECTYEQAEHYKHTRGQLAMGTITMGAAAVKASDAMKRGLEPLLRELRRTLRAHASVRRAPVERIYLCGGGSRLRSLCDFMSEELGVPVEILPVAGEEFVGVDMADGAGALYAQGLALGLRDGLPSEKRLPLNFRQGRFEHEHARSWVREKMIGIVALGLCLLCALSSVLGTHYFEVTKRHDAAKVAMEMASKRLFGEKVTDASKIRKKLKGTGESASLVPSRSAYNHYYEVYSRIPSGLELRFYDLEVDLFRQIIKVNAETDSAASVDRFVESLEGNECFKGQVQKGATKSSGELVSFDLTINPKCPEQRAAESAKKK